MLDLPVETIIMTMEELRKKTRKMKKAFNIFVFFSGHGASLERGELHAVVPNPEKAS